MLTQVLVLAVVFPALTAGVPIAGSVASGDVGAYTLDTPAGSFVHCALNQGETDLTVSLVAPGGGAVVYDERERSDELVSFVAEQRGTYRLEVRTVGATVRRVAYALVCEQPRPAASLDLELIETEVLATQARQAYRRGDAESLREALEKRRRSLAGWQKLGRRAAELAALGGLGDTYYRLSQYADADAVYRQALTLSRQLRDKRGEAEVLTNLATTARPLGNVSEALRFLEEALTLWHDLRLANGEGVALMNRGVLLKETGDLDAAREHYRRALKIFRALGDRRLQGYVSNNLAMALESLGQKSAALQELDRSVPLLREARDWRAAGRALVSRARLQLALGDRRLSLPALRQGLELIHRTGDALAEADAIEQRGRIHAAAGDVESARIDFRQALAIYRTTRSRRGQSDALHDIALTFATAHDYVQAIEFLKEALGLRQAIGVRSLEADTLAQLAQAERQAGLLDEAYGHAAAAVAIIEQLDGGIVENELRISYFSSQRRYYGELIDVLMTLDRQRPGSGFAQKAFEAADNARARSLVERVRDLPASAESQDAAELIARERRSRKEVSYWSWVLWQQADAATPEEATRMARASLDAAMAAHTQAEGDIRRANPRHPLLPMPMLAVDDLKTAALDKDSVILAYWLTDAHSYAWTMTSDRIAGIELPNGNAIPRRARRFTQLIGDPNTPADAYAVAGAALSRLALLPVVDDLTRRRIVLIADGALNLVPFSVLPEPRGHRLLVETHEIVNVPSAAMLLLLARDAASRDRAPRLIAAIGDGVFDPSDPRVVRRDPVVSTPGRPYRRVSRLPFSREEVETVVGMVPRNQGFSAVDFDANRTLMSSPALRQFRYVHLATHAIRSDERPALSGIMLSMVTPDGRAQDGFLRLQDVYSLRWRAAELVTLSACETGAGQNVSGEGLMSLAHGFFAAGVLRVLVTSWRVEDEAAKTFMILFYSALFHGSAPSIALQKAQLAMMSRQSSRFRHPAYWAGFALEGIP